MGGVNFAWLAVWVPSPDWPSRKLQVCKFLALRWSRRAWGRGVRAVPQFAFYTLAFALQLRKITESLSQGS